jgi:hypothetical protein
MLTDGQTPATADWPNVGKHRSQILGAIGWPRGCCCSLPRIERGLRPRAPRARPAPERRAKVRPGADGEERRTTKSSIKTVVHVPPDYFCRGSGFVPIFFEKICSPSALKTPAATQPHGKSRFQ